MKILALCSYPVESAATRYRLIQFVEPLAERGINLTVSPFLDSPEFANFYRPGRFSGKAVRMLRPLKKRFVETFSVKNFDAVLVQREALMFGPPVFEWLAKIIGGRPLILDLDDATYIRYVSPTYGRLGSALKFFGKTDSLINWSQAVICGNRFIAEYVTARGGRAVVVPTVVDPEKFRPAAKKNEGPPIIGWIGTHSTFPSLEWLFPVFQDLAKKYEFKLKIVGAGRDKIEIEGVEVENLEWQLDREIADFQSLDIGLYPMVVSKSADQEWLIGKSGFKAVQYLSLGIPFVVSPIGVGAEIGIEGETHFSAVKCEDWYQALEKLLQSPDKIFEMGEKGRKYALSHYTILQQTDKIEVLLNEAVKNFK